MNLLTPAELHQLTDCARKGDQVQWLRERGWAFDIGETGRPKVDRAEYERHMIGGGKRKEQKKGPDTSWYGSTSTS